MKKLLQGILITSLFLCVMNVNAEEQGEVFFTNKNGVAFTKFQYDTVVDAAGLEAVLNMSLEEYEKTGVDMFTSEFTKIQVIEDNSVINNNYNLGISTLENLYHETAYKKLTGITTCTNSSAYCLINIILDWKKQPKIRSYDVIGTRISGTTFYDNVATAFASMGDASVDVSAQKRESNGRASVIKLSANYNILYVTFTTRVNKGGMAQVSYQHAANNIAKYDALNFSFTAAGLGKVFDYPTSIAKNYDDMAGIGLKIS